MTRFLLFAGGGLLALPLACITMIAGIGGSSIGSAAAVPASPAALSAIPPDYLQLYQAAARTCPGLPWTVLAAIGTVESGNGRTSATSSAGAQGPMQFLPATFAAYAVPTHGDRAPDINDPGDAIYAAAKLLCADGGGDPATLADAVRQYDHDDWYVRRVLELATTYADAPLGAGGLDDFPAGECTYYVAQHREVTWSGNADEWLANASAAGATTSTAPSVGAIAVYGPGGHGQYSLAYGHVALVTGVTATSYTVSEMNYAGPGVVDSRTIAWPDPDVLGFIP
ncbi:MAG: CHAP domain-containing protein [Candidatus Dormibacteria bacterium]